MDGLNSILNAAAVAVLAFGAFMLYLLKVGAESAVKTSAEEAAKAASQHLQSAAQLAKELQKTRGIERQELRFKSYGGLWKRLRPLAIYDDAVVDKKLVEGLSSSFTDWYFSECGGLLLTPQARDFYFALQDLVRRISKLDGDWSIDRLQSFEGEHKEIFINVLTEVGKSDAVSVLTYLEHRQFNDWQSESTAFGEKWRKAVNEVAAAWLRLDSKQKFATLQQVGSVLRTCLAIDLESRSR